MNETPRLNFEVQHWLVAKKVLIGCLGLMVKWNLANDDEGNPLCVGCLAFHLTESPGVH